MSLYDKDRHDNPGFIDILRAILIMAIGFATFVVAHLVDPYLHP